MILLSLCYLVVVGFMTCTQFLLRSLFVVRVFVKTGERRYHTIHGDSILLIGCCDSGKTALFYVVGIWRFRMILRPLKTNSLRL